MYIHNLIHKMRSGNAHRERLNIIHKRPHRKSHKKLHEIIHRLVHKMRDAAMSKRRAGKAIKSPG